MSYKVKTISKRAYFVLHNCMKTTFSIILRTLSQVTSLFGDDEKEQKMKFRCEVTSIAMAPDYVDSGRIVIGSDKITLCEKGLLGSKKSTTLAVGCQGKIAKIDWTYPDHIVWADSKDVKIFDLSKREVISIIPRQSSGLGFERRNFPVSKTHTKTPQRIERLPFPRQFYLE